MQNDEHTEDDELQQKDDMQPEVVKDEKGEDYQGKLNATNRFLKKEGYEFKDGKWVKEVKEAPAPVNPGGGMSYKDVVALNNSKVHEDDFSEVEEFAKFKGISIADALKSQTLKSILKDKEDERKTAEATNTGKARPSPAKADTSKIIEDAYAGKLPEDPAELARAEHAEKLKRLQN